MKRHKRRDHAPPPAQLIQAVAVLCAVRSGAEGAAEVVRATGLRPLTVIQAAQELVALELLCALDGEPWAVRVEAFPLTERP